MRSLLKKIIVQTATFNPVNTLASRAMSPFTSIFMLHRIEDKDLSIYGDSLPLLEETLRTLRKDGFTFLSIEEILRHLRDGHELPRKSVAFSFDDGFWDQAEKTGSLMAKYDCPATYFITTGFLDGEIWFWDSKVQYLLENSERQAWQFMANNLDFPLLDSDGELAVISKATQRLKEFDLETIDGKLDAIASLMGLTLAKSPPEKYAPMTHSQACELEAMGMRIAPHSLSHPILANETDAESERQILLSWKRIKEIVKDPSPVFCYPVGRAQDFGNREMLTVKDSEMIGGVSAIQGYVDGACANSLYDLPRFGFPDNWADIKQYSSWFERFKEKLRA